MPGSLEQPIEAHSRVPVQPVHYFGQLFCLSGLQQIMDVVAHDTQSVQLEAVLLLRSMNGVQQNFLAGFPGEVEGTIVAPHGYVIAVTWLEISQFSWQVTPPS